MQILIMEILQQLLIQTGKKNNIPKETTAVTCENCKKMHPFNGRFIIVTATIKQNLKPCKIGETIIVEDVVACNNHCLEELLSLDGF